MSGEGDRIATLQDKLRLDEQAATPLYRQLTRRILHAIECGDLEVGDALPSERELAQWLGVSRVTVRKAVGGLVHEGLLTQQQGAGTFVAPRVEQPLSLLTSFTEDMRLRGMVPGVTWLERTTGLANPEEAMALGLSPGSEVSRLHRLRTANGKPMALELATVPRACLADPSMVQDSLYDALHRTGHRPHRALQRLRAELLDEKEARALGVLPGSPALYIERRSFLADGQPVEFTRSHYRGDSYDFVAELQIGNRADRTDQTHAR